MAKITKRYLGFCEPSYLYLFDLSRHCLAPPPGDKIVLEEYLSRGPPAPAPALLTAACVEEKKLVLTMDSQAAYAARALRQPGPPLRGHIFSVTLDLRMDLVKK